MNKVCNSDNQNIINKYIFIIVILFSFQNIYGNTCLTSLFKSFYTLPLTYFPNKFLAPIKKEHLDSFKSELQFILDLNISLNNGSELISKIEVNNLLALLEFNLNKIIIKDHHGLSFNHKLEAHSKVMNLIDLHRKGLLYRISELVLDVKVKNINSDKVAFLSDDILLKNIDELANVQKLIDYILVKNNHIYSENNKIKKTYLGAYKISFEIDLLKERILENNYSNNEIIKHAILMSVSDLEKEFITINNIKSRINLKDYSSSNYQIQKMYIILMKKKYNIFMNLFKN